jgi:signal transduction histidine kinase
VQLAFAGYLGYVLTLPRRYVPARWLNVLPCLALAVIVVDLAALAPAPMWGHQAFMVVWTLALPLAMGWQWRRSHSPLLRALMQWFALGGLILLARLALIHALPVQDLETRAFSSAPASWRSRLTPSSCSWSARCWVGRRGLRRILLWVLASLLLVVCDLMLVLALSVQAETACSSACWWWVRPICLAWLDCTDLAGDCRCDWSSTSLRCTTWHVQPSIPTAALQAWHSFCSRCTSPEQCAGATGGFAQPHAGSGWRPVGSTGMDGQGVVLVHAHGGRRLFGPQDERFADHCALVPDHGGESRAATQARQSERERIAHDLHDDLGARLLHMAHAAPLATGGVMPRTRCRRCV